jgi:hypothetical protein
MKVILTTSVPQVSGKNTIENKAQKLRPGQWLTAIIPATQEAKIRRTTVGGQPGQKTSETPCQSVS